MYKPVAKNIEEGEKNIGMLINAYDNTIRYTDFLLNSLINTLREMKDWHSAMIFISDHGESLGENKMFMHSHGGLRASRTDQLPLFHIHAHARVWSHRNHRNHRNIRFAHCTG